VKPIITWQTGLGLGLTPLLIALGQLLFKQAGLRLSANGQQNVLQTMLDPFLIAALALYGIGTLLWVYVLSRLPLSQAYPFMAFTYILVPVASMLLFKETIPPAYWIGAALIIAGVVVMAFSA